MSSVEPPHQPVPPRLSCRRSALLHQHFSLLTQILIASVTVCKQPDVSKLLSFSPHLSSWLLMYIYCLLPSQTSPPRLSPGALNLCPNKTHDLYPPYPAPKQNKTKLKAKPPGLFFYAPLLVSGPIVHPLYNPDMYVWGIATYIPPLPSVPNPLARSCHFIPFLYPFAFLHLTCHHPNSEQQFCPLNTFSIASQLASPIHS